MADSYIEYLTDKLTDRIIEQMKLNVPEINNKPLTHRVFYRKLIKATIYQTLVDEGIE